MSLETQTIMIAYNLAGEFEDRICDAFDRGKASEIMELACDLAKAAIEAERERAGSIVQGIIDEDLEDAGDWSSGWRSAGDAFMVELFDIQPQGWEEADARLAADRQRGEQIMQVMQDALDNTMARPSSRRGPYVIADNDEDA